MFLSDQELLAAGALTPRGQRLSDKQGWEVEGGLWRAIDTAPLDRRCFLASWGYPQDSWSADVVSRDPDSGDIRALDGSCEGRYTHWCDIPLPAPRPSVCI